jgi:endogenous inhibitor of DNA gyrase (YacG/DUF329 family)
MSTCRCPVCDRRFDTESSPRTLPFCSDRCRKIDLGRWLNEDYGLPIARDEEEPDAERPLPPDDADD